VSFDDISPAPLVISQVPVADKIQAPAHPKEAWIRATATLAAALALSAVIVFSVFMVAAATGGAAQAGANETPVELVGPVAPTDIPIRKGMAER
jgi:hypothetical protein